MNRKEFFKKLGLGIAGAIIAPKVITEIKEEKQKYTVIREEPEIYGNGWYHRTFRTDHSHGEDYHICSTFAPWEYDDPLENAFHMQKDIDNRLLHG